MSSGEGVATVLVLGDGPSGILSANLLKDRQPELRVVNIGQGNVNPSSWPRTTAWPAAAFLQPSQDDVDGRILPWFWQTLTWADGLIGKRPDAAHLVDVTSVHNRGAGYRPHWAKAVATEELAGKYTPIGWQHGFRWKTYALDPIEARAEMLAEANKAGVVYRKEHVGSLDHVVGLSDAYDARVVIDALGLSSNKVFGDERIGGEIGHLLRWPNLDPKDARAVVADDDLQFVISGPKWIYAGDRHEQENIDPRHVHVADLGPTESIEDTIMSALYFLRPDLAYALEDTPPEHVAGIWPTRPGGARVELELLPRIPPVIHLTGLGKTGWSLCYGAAREATELALELL